MTTKTSTLEGFIEFVKAQPRDKNVGSEWDNCAVAEYLNTSDWAASKAFGHDVLTVLYDPCVLVARTYGDMVDRIANLEPTIELHIQNKVK